MMFSEVSSALQCQALAQSEHGLRWRPPVLLEPERRFHRIAGCRQIPLLIAALSSDVDIAEVVA